ncbi:MAG: hypothetical protein QXH80_01355 [Candidatus Nanoarchaeia archaeon]
MDDINRMDRMDGMDKGKKNAYFLLLLAALINVFVVFTRFPLSEILYKAIVKKDRTAFAFVERIDSALSKVRGKGNVFLFFDGFSDDIGKGMGNPRDVASLIYFRICQQLFPQKVFVSKEKMKIVRGTEFLDKDFSIPDEEWLSENNVDFVMKFFRAPDGAVSLDLIEK